MLSSRCTLEGENWVNSAIPSQPLAYSALKDWHLPFKLQYVMSVTLKAQNAPWTFREQEQNCKFNYLDGLNRQGSYSSYLQKNNCRTNRPSHCFFPLKTLYSHVHTLRSRYRDVDSKLDRLIQLHFALRWVFITCYRSSEEDCLDKTCNPLNPGKVIFKTNSQT